MATEDLAYKARKIDDEAGKEEYRSAKWYAKPFILIKQKASRLEEMVHYRLLTEKERLEYIHIME